MANDLLIEAIRKFGLEIDAIADLAEATAVPSNGGPPDASPTPAIATSSPPRFA